MLNIYQNKMILQTHLTARLGGISYDIARLGSDFNNGDLYYHFCYPKGFEDWALNLEIVLDF